MSLCSSSAFSLLLISITCVSCSESSRFFCCSTSSEVCSDTTWSCRELWLNSNFSCISFFEANCASADSSCLVNPELCDLYWSNCNLTACSELVASCNLSDNWSYFISLSFSNLFVFVSYKAILSRWEVSYTFSLCRALTLFWKEEIWILVCYASISKLEELWSLLKQQLLSFSSSSMRLSFSISDSTNRLLSTRNLSSQSTPPHSLSV